MSELQNSEPRALRDLQLRCFVRRVRIRGQIWQWFTTEPLVYSVLRVYDRTLTDQQFLEQQVALAKAHKETNGWLTP